MIRIHRIAILVILAGCAGEVPRMSASADGTRSAAPADTAAARRTGDSAAYRAGYTGEMRETARITAPNGVITIEAPDSPHVHTATLKVDGRTVFSERVLNGLSVHAFWEYPPIAVSEDPGGPRNGPRGSTALIGVQNGGTGCPVEYRIVEIVYRDSTAVTERFGTCAELPDSVWFDAEGALRMRFQDYAPLAVQMDTSFDYTPQPPVTYVYRGKGRLEVSGRR